MKNEKNILFLVLGFLIAYSFTFIKTTYRAQDKTTQVKGLLNLEQSILTIPDEGTYAPSEITYSPITSYIVVNCLDQSGGCNVTLDDAGGISGDYVVFTESPVTGDNAIRTSNGGFAPIFADVSSYGAEVIHDGTRWGIIR